MTGKKYLRVLEMLLSLWLSKMLFAIPAIASGLSFHFKLARGPAEIAAFLLRDPWLEAGSQNTLSIGCLVTLNPFTSSMAVLLSAKRDTILLLSSMWKGMIL